MRHECISDAKVGAVQNHDDDDAARSSVRRWMRVVAIALVLMMVGPLLIGAIWSVSSALF